ncbi:MAG: 30S ribosomal protein S1 [Planctomycetes bacterium]|nr:30S ribosomal protein S1 [Planctomycetota bacterium]MBU1519025.1 30S ribosomal protein S1 [Planctomycetota bacterium]MBU2597450.1 30S ribosomal protein S1 [Planctomycetota bacterium]
MVDRNIFSRLGFTPEELDSKVNELFTADDDKLLSEALEKKVDALTPGTILKGRIMQQIGNDVILEIGLKSEGVVDVSEFDGQDEIQIGSEIEVLLEEVDSGGLILLSKRKADRIRGWQQIVNTKKEGDIVTGKVIRRIKGGLLVDIGVPVFLPASQVDIRKPGDISRFIGQEVTCEILKIDTDSKNIVISRRKIIEQQRSAGKEKLLAEIEVGQTRKGVVKNIADFGVFVDLGGLDGLLHISDLSWGRVSHPSEVVRLDQEIECMVIGIDKENEKVSLGLKQKSPSPWENIETRYPVNAKVKGTVVNVMNYGIFVRLEEGVEGLVHISEMSWTRKINHPGDLYKLGDQIDVVILEVNKDKQEISLGVKQLEVNPWAVASQKYPPGTIVEVKVTSLTNYGSFVEIEPGIDGLIHISDISWTKKYNHPGEALQKDQQIKCVVLEVDEEKQRISLGVKQLTEDPWVHAITEKYLPGQIVKGVVTKITNFGVFVELEPDLEGLLHISEIADHKIDNPQDIVKPQQEVEVKILRVDSDSRKIGLSMRRVKWAEEDQKQAAEKAQSQPDQQTKKDATNNEGLMIPLLKKESAPSDESKDEAKSDEPKDETESDEPKDETKPDESKDETEKAE